MQAAAGVKAPVVVWRWECRGLPNQPTRQGLSTCLCLDLRLVTQEGTLSKLIKNAWLGKGSYYYFLNILWVIPIDNVTLPFNERSFSLLRTVVNVETHSSLGVESKWWMSGHCYHHLWGLGNTLESAVGRRRRSCANATLGVTQPSVCYTHKRCSYLLGAAWLTNRKV